MSRYVDLGLHASSKDQTWTTPRRFFDELNEEFNFTLDPCCMPETAKCSKFYTPFDDGLTKDWTGEIVFCNPPYNDIKRWIRKCSHEGSKPGTTVVMLIPAKTDTIHFHKYIYGKADIRFVKGRLRFNDGPGRSPHPSMIVIFKTTI